MKYSKAEEAMFAELGLGDLLQHWPTTAYRSAVETAFFDRLDGPAVEALRRTAKAFLVDGEPKRLTPEFDRLATWGGPSLATLSELPLP